MSAKIGTPHSILYCAVYQLPTLADASCVGPFVWIRQCESDFLRHFEPLNANN